MKENEKLDGYITIPSTKDAHHDHPISGTKVHVNISKVFLCFVFSVHGEFEWFAVSYNS
jgi:hypothetical protein